MSPSSSKSAHDFLPEPAEEAKLLSRALTQRIVECCQRDEGYMAFSDYMQMALYEPGLGYYVAGRQKFGEQGDFVTAPEVSSLFSQCLGYQVAEVLGALSGETLLPCVLEFGAGSGVMAADCLLMLEQLNSLPETYFILEPSAELRLRQRQTLQQKAPHLVNRVEWLDALPAEPVNGVIVANEVLDAMPVECFRIAEERIESLFVSYEKDALVASYRPADQKIVDRVAVINQRLGETRNDNLAVGYCSEYNPAIKPWLDSLYHILNRGVVLLVDYGYPAYEYYHEERKNGTLICHYQHRAHTNALWYPGLQDITAFVDFTDVAYSAVEAGFDLSGYTTQAAFLMASGLEELHQQQLTDDIKSQLLLSQQIKTLTLPSEMGERFKAMALSKNYDEALKGFSLQDLRNRL